MMPALLYALAFFVDPLVFYRSLFGSDLVSSVLVIAVLTGTAWRLLPALQESAKSRSTQFILIVLVAHCIISLTTRIRIGLGITDVIQHAVFIFQIIFLNAALQRTSERSSLINGFMFAIVIHATTLLPIPALAQSLSANTGYATGDYAVGLITRRATGFFPAPGFLSLFATAGLCIGLALLETDRRKAGVAMIALSCLLGIASLSRSFFVVMPLMLLIHGFRQGLASILWVCALLTLLLYMAPEIETLNRYLEILDTRMTRSIELDTSDRLSGPTGLEESLKVIEHWPLFGRPAVDDGALQAWNGTILVRPHTGVITLLAYYGFILGLPLLLLIGQGGSTAIRAIFIKSSRLNIFLYRHQQPASLFALGFVGVNIICLVEPLIETVVYFLFLLGVLAQVNRTTPIPRPAT